MKLKKKKGLTLIEVIIAMAILGIVMATVTVMFTSNSNILSKVDAKSELQLEAQMIQEQLSIVALESSGLISTTENHLTLKDSDDEKISHHFKVEDGELEGKTLIYEKITNKDDGSNEVLLFKKLSSHINNFNIEKNSNSISYCITLASKKGKNHEVLTISNKIVFRNY